MTRMAKISSSKPSLLISSGADRWLCAAHSVGVIVSRPAPLLEHADVSLSSAIATTGEAPLFGGIMPRVQKLRLTGIGLPLGPPSTLRELKIENSPREGPSLRDLVSILYDNPDLEQIKLSSMRMAVEDIPEQVLIHLPRLQQLVLGRLPPLAT